MGFLFAGVPAVAAVILCLALPSPLSAGPLHDAARAGRKDQLLTILRENPAGVDAIDSHGNTALHVAAAHGRKEVVEALLAAHANPRATAPDGATPLHYAALARDAEAFFKRLMNLGIGTEAARQLESGKPAALSTATEEALRANISHLSAGSELSPEQEADHLAIVRMLIAAGADVNAPSANGAPACFAAMSFRKDIILALLDSGADPEVKNCPNDASPLYLFVLAGNPGDVPEVIERLASRGADANAQDRMGGTPLGVACKTGDLAAARTLIKRGADVNKTSWNAAPLFHSVHKRDLEMVRLLIASKASVNAKDERGWTLLNEAVSQGNRSVVEALLVAGADVNARDEEGFTPLMTATERGDRAIAEALLAAHADINLRKIDGETALSKAIFFGNNELVAALLAAGADPGQTVRRGSTVLHGAAQEGDARIARTLIERGAAVDARADDGSTPLHWVALEPTARSAKAAKASGVPLPEAKAETARLLLEHGAGVDARSADGYTPLMTAAESGNVPLIRVLTEAKAEINAHNSRDKHTALISAAAAGHPEAVRTLLGARADIAAKDVVGATALHWGAAFPDVVQALLEGGASPDPVDFFGQTPLFQAVSKGARRSVELLLAAGADIGRFDNRGRTVLAGRQESKDQEMTHYLLDLTERAAAAGTPGAQNLMGYLHQTGTAVAQDHRLALEFYRRAAEQGHADAQNNMGWMYQHGLGVPQDAAAALTWYRASAAQGYPVGQHNLGMMYYSGFGVVQDEEEAIRWIRKAAEGGHDNALVVLGTILYDRGSYEEGRKWLLRGADAVHQGAFAALGEASLQGAGVEKNLVEAASWFLLGASLGDEKSNAKLRDLEERTTEQERTAAYDRAWLWQEDWNRRHETNFLRLIPPRGTPATAEGAKPEKPLVALDVLIAAANNGDAEAQANLGQRYLKGEGGAGKDSSAAAEWFARAAMQDSVEAQFWLGVLLARGEGVPKDYIQARTWFILAKKGGHPKAQDLLDGISAWMTGEQIEESERQAKQFKAMPKRSNKASEKTDSPP